MIATIATMQTMVAALPSDKNSRLDTSLGLRAMVRTAPPSRELRLAKFSRLTPSETPVLQVADLTTGGIRAAQERRAAKALKTSQIAAVRQNLRKAFTDQMTASAAADRIVTASVAAAADKTNTQMQVALAGVPPVLVSALVEEIKPEQNASLPQPFDLVMTGPDEEIEALLPDSVPLPVNRPPGVVTTILPPGADKDDDKDPASDKTGGKRPGAGTLAYAKPNKPVFDDDLLDNVPSPALPRAGSRVAVYDLSAGVVYLPSGERLEAHSGIGHMRDNPKYVHVKMRGATPPSTYHLTMREALFHGVEALRLTPVNGIAPRGRDGLLAHTYMLRTPGDSNGCVVFKDYRRFLKAFKRGEITQMVVVENMPRSGSIFASAQPTKRRDRESR